jgi:hypothetical protein
MKTTLSLLALIGCLSTGYAQTIRRVNANPAVTGTNVYQTLQAAHDAATAGDIIIVEASSVSCGNLVATKGLKIYGKGYFTDANTDLHISPNPSLAGNITFDGPTASNSEISGVTCAQLNIKGASNIRAYRNRVTGASLVDAQNVAGTDYNVSNIQISQNFLEGNTNVNSTATTGIFTISITNNYLYYVQNSAANISGMIVNNNIVEYYAVLTNVTFQNNIMIGNNTFSSFTSCTRENNIALANETDLPTGSPNFNQINYDFDVNDTFEVITTVANSALPAGVSEDERWRIKSGAALKTASTTGDEVGMYGGLNPYVPSGIPSAPSIIKLVTPDYGNTAAALPVTISIKSNN